MQFLAQEITHRQVTLSRLLRLLGRLPLLLLLVLLVLLWRRLGRLWRPAHSILLDILDRAAFVYRVETTGRC